MQKNENKRQEIERLNEMKVKKLTKSFLSLFKKNQNQKQEIVRLNKMKEQSDLQLIRSTSELKT